MHIYISVIYNYDQIVTLSNFYIQLLKFLIFFAKTCMQSTNLCNSHAESFSLRTAECMDTTLMKLHVHGHIWPLNA